MTKLRTALAALISMSAASSASAQNFSCSVNPSAYLALDAGGNVWTGVKNSIVHVCNVGATIGDVTPEACTGWYGSLLTWRTLGKTGLVYFSASHPANQGATSCDQFSHWQTRIPYHFEGA